MDKTPPPLYSRSDVAALLGVPLRTLTWWTYALDPDRRYRRFEIERRSSAAPREIYAPIKPIKDMQRRLAGVLTSLYEPRASVHGFALGRSPVTNARRHLRQQWVLRADLVDFFPSINFGRVRGLFMAFPFDYSDTVATMLAQVCCHKNILPQGAPTSPIISNLICRGMDSDLSSLARAERCYYTRYADDLSFSTDRSVFPGSIATWNSKAPPTVGHALASVIANHGFQINHQKTRLMRDTQRQRVTGLIVNKKLNVNNAYIRELRNLLHIWRRHGEQDASDRYLLRHGPPPNWPPGKSARDFKLMLRGRIQYVGSIRGWDDEIYLNLAGQLSALDKSFSPSETVRLRARQVIKLYVEGETDGPHLTAAFQALQAGGEFPYLELEILAEADSGGGSKLAARAKTLATLSPSVPCICLFDTDDKQVLNSVGLAAEQWKVLGRGVAVARIGVPAFRSEDEPLCIEMLYSDEELAIRDSRGRRLYLAAEFDAKHGHHTIEAIHALNPVKKTLVREEVIDTATKAPVALSKAEFAACVSSAAGTFGTISFSGFRQTFALIEAIAVRLAATP